jgi:hypothetical protein
MVVTKRIDSTGYAHRVVSFAAPLLTLFYILNYYQYGTMVSLSNHIYKY